MYNFVREELERLIRLEMQKIPKIAIFGLENAGKTTLVKTVLYEFENLISFAPTMTMKAKNFELLGRELIILDVGGINRYTNYIYKENGKKWIGIEYFYFIVDVQDRDSIRLSIANLLKLLEFLRPINPKMEVFLFFHKYDLDDPRIPIFEENEATYLEILLPKLQQENHHIVVFYTSIKDKENLISTFTQPLLRNKDLYSTLCGTVKQFCTENNLDFGILLVDEHEIAHYYRHHESLIQMNEALIEIYQRYQMMQKYGRLDTKYEGEKRIHSNLFKLQVRGKTFDFCFHIGLRANLHEREMEHIKELTHEFTNNLSKILQHSEIIRMGELRTEEIK